MSRKMDAFSEKVWFGGRNDRTRKGFNLRKYEENYEKIFGKRKPLHGIPDDEFEKSKKSRI